MLTLSAPFEHEVVLQKSRFLARARPAADREEALALIASLRDESATHNCYAWRLGADYRFNDDGEPGGTAGQPILRAIDSQGLDQVLVLVTRWFGGIKLGAGGLARAYGNTAAECLRLAPRVEVLPLLSLVLRAPFDCLGAVYHLMESFGAGKPREGGGERFDAEGLTVTLTLTAEKRPAFEAALRDATRGRAKLEEQGAP